MNSIEKPAKEKGVIHFDDLYNLKQITEVTLRPQSEEIYFVINQANKQDNDYRETIWRVKGKAQQFSQGLGRDSALKWAPNGNQLAFLSVRISPKAVSKKENKQPPKPQIYLLPADGGEGLPLTSMPNGVLPNFEWSRDGTKLVFISKMNKEELFGPAEEELKSLDPDAAMLLEMKKKKAEEKKVEPRIITREVYRTGTSFLDDRKGQIHVVDVSTKKVERWTNSLEDDYTVAFLLPDNSAVITSRQKPGESDETRNWEFVKITPDGTLEVIVEDHYNWGGYFQLSPNGKYIATSMGKRELGTLGQTSLVIYEVATGKRRVLAEEIDNEKVFLKWSENSNYLYFIVMEKGKSAIWRVEIATQKVEKIVNGDKIIFGYDISTDNSWLVYQSFHVNDPSRLYKYTISSGEEELVYAPNKEFLATKKLGKTEEIWYDGFNNDFKIQGWILTPPDFNPEKKYPLALNMHGGPHVMWSCHQSIPMFHEFQLLAANGYVVFYCNPRGSNGYGQKFYQACEKRWGAPDSGDILNGVELVVSKGFIDEKRMAITGGSYAGFLTAWMIGHDNRFACAVAQRGVYFLSGFWASTDAARVLIDDEFGTTPLGDHLFLWERSPAAYAKNIKTPLRIIHSELDFRVPISDAEMLYTALKREQPKLDVEFVRYPKEGHELSRSGQPTRRIDRLEKIVEWFDKYCQPKKYKQELALKEKIEKIKEQTLKKMSEKIKNLQKKS
ncbi:MAG: prolyl oligopeptidase family serine peptidase [Candidatus Heimdallarchaeota archaeon]